MRREWRGTTRASALAALARTCSLSACGCRAYAPGEERRRATSVSRRMGVVNQPTCKQVICPTHTLLTCECGRALGLARARLAAVGALPEVRRQTSDIRHQTTAVGRKTKR